ncbi:MAG TPA: DUF2442 domain-containing protein [Saprospiraceae bacterium]|nr:DUF2442 domain-containing protein [Saprospiraceae bacterium]
MDILRVKPLEFKMLEIEFENNEIRVFDLKPYLSIGIFQELNDEAKFIKVRPFFNSLVWESGQDLSSDTLYLKSIPTAQSSEIYQ